MEELISEWRAHEAVKDIRIPPQPEVLRQAHMLLQKDVSDMLAIARLISRDAGLCAAVLKLVNSSFMGVITTVSSVQHGIALLGLKQVINIVAGVAMRQTMERHQKVPTPWFWESTPPTAALCATFSRALNLGPADMAYTVGLFHDCGLPLLAQKFPQYMAVLSGEEPRLAAWSHTVLEEELMDTHHGVVGYLLTKSWGLDPVIRRIVLNHHDEEEIRAGHLREDRRYKPLLVCLKLAEHGYALKAGSPDYVEWMLCRGHIADYLGMSELDLDDLCDKLIESQPLN
jgi:HD-like signal output (HDOD) protein